jgi:hypothetical protein
MKPTSAAALHASALVACALLAACVAHEPRVTRMITNMDGLVLSNGPAVNDAHEPSARGERLIVRYGLFAENLGASRALLDIVSAHASLTEVGQALTGDRFRIACLERDAAPRAAPVVVLEPGERTRVDCEVELTHTLAMSLQSADRELVLAIPVHTADEHALLFFDYLLQVGDAP